MRESTIVPNVAVVREAVADEAQAIFLHVLFDGIEGFLLGNLHLGVGPAGHFNNHVEDTIVLVSEKRNIMEGRDDGAVLLNEYAMFYKKN